MVETDVIHLDESDPEEQVEVHREEGDEARASADEGGSFVCYSRSSHRGKELVVEETKPTIGLEYPYPHRVTEIGEEEWEMMTQYLNRTLGVGPRYGQEFDTEHCYQPAHNLDARGMVLGSHLTQSRAVEQFWLPRDEEFQQRVPNVGVHLSLQSYLVRDAFVEQDIYDRMEQIRTTYLKLLEEVASQRAGRGVN